MPNVAEDVYYVPRAEGEAIGLNQLMALPQQLSTVEIEAILRMCGRSKHTMACRVTKDPVPATLPADFPAGLEVLQHGLYYVDPDGAAWLISNDDTRPDLDGPAMDFAIATVQAGEDNLSRLRAELRSR